MNLTKLSKEIREANLAKGFAIDKRDARYLLLAISEICEAQDELRSNRGLKEIYYEGEKPCGFPVEIADAIIRLLDLAGHYGFEVRTLEGYFRAQDDTIEQILLDVCYTIAEIGRYSGKDERDKNVQQALICSAISRLAALCNTYYIPIYHVIDEKLKYNATREPKHGRQF